MLQESEMCTSEAGVIGTMNSVGKVFSEEKTLSQRTESLLYARDIFRCSYENGFNSGKMHCSYLTLMEYIFCNVRMQYNFISHIFDTVFTDQILAFSLHPIVNRYAIQQDIFTRFYEFHDEFCASRLIMKDDLRATLKCEVFNTLDISRELTNDPTNVSNCVHNISMGVLRMARLMCVTWLDNNGPWMNTTEKDSCSYKMNKKGELKAHQSKITKLVIAEFQKLLLKYENDVNISRKLHDITNKGKWFHYDDGNSASIASSEPGSVGTLHDMALEDATVRSSYTNYGKSSHTSVLSFSGTTITSTARSSYPMYGKSSHTSILSFSGTTTTSIVPPNAVTYGPNDRQSRITVKLL